AKRRVAATTATLTPTTVTSPCAWSGSLRKSTKHPLETLDGQALGYPADVVVEGLTPARFADGPYLMTITAPIRVAARLHCGEEPVAAKARFSIAGEHVWLDDRYPLAVRAKSDDKVAVEKTFGRDDEPSHFAREVRCSEVALFDEVGVMARPLPKGGVFFGDRKIDLFDGRDGARVGATTRGAFVAERSAGWAHVVGRWPFAFDAWTRDDPAAMEGGIGEAHVGRVTADVQLTRDVLFRTGASPSAPVSGTIVRGARLIVGPMSNGVHAVQVAGLTEEWTSIVLLYVAHDDLAVSWEPVAAASAR
ncbi:MAG: hypothetical protein ACHREM_23880, partial [Polyangiales bacterium]